MKIASSTLSLQAQHRATQSVEQSEKLQLWTGPRPRKRGPQVDTREGAQASRLQRTPQAGSPVFERPQMRRPEQTSVLRERHPFDNTSPYMAMVRDLIELVTGVRAQRVRGRGEGAAPATANQTPTAAQASASASAGFGLQYEQHTVREETEITSFSAQGLVRTADGQEISFRLELLMQRAWREESHLSVRLGDAALTDPLVLNFNGAAAQLQDVRFAFDLDADGQEELIPLLAGHSGYLAFDRNGNGRIDDGRELFGPTSGNGFTELAAHDQDGNDWIDENDAVYQDLRIWIPAAQGGGQLRTLAQAGVGALALAQAHTPFSLRAADNSTLGQIRASSVYLREDGGVGSIQQVDLKA